MPGKRPSSLDYEAFVDELAVSSFRRALAARRFVSAQASVERLVQSAERMWRWVGCQNLAVLELARGFPERALEALEDAERLYPDVPELVAASRDRSVEVLLDTADLKGALRRAEEGSYGAALALLGAGRREEAEMIARRLEKRHPAQALHIAWEAASGDADGLARLLDSLAPRERNARLRSRLARRLELEKRFDEAIAIYSAIAESEHDLLDQPVCAVRSYFRLGELESPRDVTRARGHFQTYLTFWGSGAIDRDDVARAVAWLTQQDQRVRT